MSAKLIVHKFENGQDCKSLMITINEGSNNLSGTQFSSWLDSSAFRKKVNEKSSRLVVKIASGSELSNFDLDSCAKLVDSETNTVRKLWGDDYNQIERHSVSLIYNNDANNINATNMSLNALCPLEYSLEKVKENNARIMENIHMLNRTLNYTKKKEILDTIYPKPMRSFPCETCGKCFVYETGLKRHCAMRHTTAEVQPRWQIVWTCIECFQVWPQHDLALKHSKQCSKLDSADCVREIKTSSLLQCEFCEKVFTSIPRLLKHTKLHSTQNNYECNTCETSFLSYKEAEEHWLLCPWLKAFYNFSLPKLLLCNACDRKFRNYEQLYNHRYKIGHFMAKNNSDNLGTFVYQCELCGKCFPSVQPLQTHKRQSHPYLDITSCNIAANYNSMYLTQEEHCNAIGEQ
ncbi:zinc finger protein 43-like [Ostrinia furnacalis]|uniref:zinc finger protein 43-like n=1 Tax=Ostrinia furnacalis TaxID=93504 RepID=UPI00103C5B45|nr:zinc finger protein 43-like [Ostrinia furnacalis]